MIRRVALVSPYALSVFGGAQAQVLAMSRELTARGVTVLVVAPDCADTGPHDTPALVRTFGRRLAVPANGSRAPITLSPRASGAAVAAIEAFSPDVVHFHEPVAPLLGYRALARHSHPAVGTFHRSGGGPAYTAFRPVLTRLVSHLDRSAAVSDAAAATITAATGLVPVVLFNGLETERFRERPRERSEPPTVLFVGRFEERKGARTVVEAAAASHGQWRTVVIGAGPQGPALRRLGARCGVVFPGPVSDAAKRDWLRRADVVVAASTHGESFGLVLLEPMAAEARVVASDIPGYRAAAGGYAELFAPGDAASLATALRRALVPDDRTVAAARAHAERWSMAALVDRYSSLYEEAAARFAGSLRR